MIGLRARHPAVAAALAMARNPLQSGETKLGMHGINIRPHFAPGGMPMPSARQPGEPIHTGPLHSPVAGRTDHIPVTVPEGSYVIPADIVSFWGEGNTEAGQHVMEHMFHGALILKLRQMTGHGPKQVPIAAAGGEFVVPPESVSHIGAGDMKLGHARLDEFVLKSRAMLVKTSKNLPGPKKGNK